MTVLWQVLQQKVLSANVVHTDDIPIPVQDPDREQCRTGRIWTYVSDHGRSTTRPKRGAETGRFGFCRDSRALCSVTPMPDTTNCSASRKGRSPKSAAGRMPGGSSSKWRRPARGKPTMQWLGSGNSTPSSTWPRSSMPRLARRGVRQSPYRSSPR